VAEDTEAAEEAEAEQPTPTSVVRTPRVSEPGIMDTVVGILGSIWTKIIAALLVVAGILLWFVRRGRGDEDDGSWETLDRDDIVAGAMSATETLQAPTPDESFVVVEQDSGIRPLDDETVESPAPEMPDTAETGRFGSLEDTFSSETAVNLDQTDPIAEADFHMAYGLYDQAADLINGALESDPNDKALMSKLCEIYFVWGNRDAFIDAASSLKKALGAAEDSADWDKIVIMGQQIAADHELFAGAGVAGATRAVDLSFESETEDTGVLDMDFGAASTGESEVLDLGASGDAADDTSLDFLFDDDDATTEAATEEMTREEPTAEMPLRDEPTVETPTIEDQFPGLDVTSELPSIDDSVETAVAESGQASEQTAEINLDELGLDVDGLDATELASLDDLDATGTNEVLEDAAEITGKNPEIDPDATGVQEMLDPDATTGLEDVFDPDETGMQAALEPDAADFGDVMDLDDPGATGLRLAPDETGRMPTLDTIDETDTSIDADLLDATGKTQVLSEDLAVETGTAFGDDDAETLLASFDDDETTAIADDAETLLASLDDDESTEVSGDAETLLASLDDDEDYDFAKTEALPTNAFTSDVHADETSEMPAVAGTDMDLDLDDLTAALQISGGGDTVEQLRDDATVEQPRPPVAEETTEVPTMSIGPDDMSDDLHEARTMTEVGTKLDLARAYVDMGDPAGARSILEEVLDEGDEGQRQQAQQLLDSLPG
jgi:pilus assembly protein FimV